jgi:prepilin-type processing-associated H-X9-DG protein
VGCSYKYNVGDLEYTRFPMEDPVNGIAEKKVNWAPEPALYVLIHEPPARRYLGWFVQWHFARGPSDVSEEQLEHAGHQFISPILFVDGHVARNDFTKTLLMDPIYCFEPTKDWIWYKPAPLPQSSP